MLLTLLAVCGLAISRPSTPWTVDTLLARNLAARGGADALAAIHTLRLTGTVIGAGGASQLAWVETRERPDRLRDELSNQGLTQITAWDGHEGWTMDPFGGRREPQRLPADDAKPLAEAAPIDGALLDARAHRWPITYVGVEDIDGTAAHKLRVDRPGGDVQYVWLDPDCFLEIRVLSRRTVHGVLSESIIEFGDYETVQGAVLPLLFETGSKTSTSADRTKVQIDKVEVNVTLPADAFSFPAGK